jgi:hypothetical protein
MWVDVFFALLGHGTGSQFKDSLVLTTAGEIDALRNLDRSIKSYKTWVSL